MSISSDGATVRRERILDMLQYIRGFMPRGISQNQVQLCMSMAHGLTYRKSLEYTMEMQQGGVLVFEHGFIRVKADNFKRLMELMAPDRDPDTGKLRGMMGFPSQPEPISEAPAETKLTDLKSVELRKMASKLGVYKKGMLKADLIEAIVDFHESQDELEREG